MPTTHEDVLHVADTRPALFLGVPIALAVPLGMAAILVTFLIPGLKSIVWAICLVGPVWAVVRPLCSRDYNAPRVFILWADTAMRDYRSAEWGGATIEPLPHHSGGPRP
jgi:type IV secretory pathway VirB3-like protein